MANQTSEEPSPESTRSNQGCMKQINKLAKGILVNWATWLVGLPIVAASAIIVHNRAKPQPAQTNEHHFTEVISGSDAVSNESHDGTLEFAAKIVTTNNDPFTLKGVVAGDTATFKEGAATRLSSPNLAINIKRYPGVSYDEKQQIRSPFSEFSEWYLDGSITFSPESSSPKGIAPPIKWNNAKEDSTLFTESSELNCRFEINFRVVENPSNNHTLEQKCTIPDACFIVIIKIQYSTLDRKNKQGNCTPA